MSSISVCIPTYCRSALLARALEHVGSQERWPGEIIVVDGSPDDESLGVVERFRLANPGLTVGYIRTECRALPWMRWVASSRAVSDWVFFVDDDVSLAPRAVKVLENALASFEAHGRRETVAGIGFGMAFAEGPFPCGRRDSFREWWLGTRGHPSGCVTPGGLTVNHPNGDSEKAVRVEYLWGGAMAFRRAVIEKIGCLSGLIELYVRGLGRGEDAVLSARASRYGELYLITAPLAIHPRERGKAVSPYASGGWRLGLTETWSRAHVQRWLGRSAKAVWRTWARKASLELLRSGIAIVKTPLVGASWLRAIGTVVGIASSLWKWHEIPANPECKYEKRKPE